MERGNKLIGMEENLAVVMMRVRRSVRTALRDAVREVGLTQNEIEVLLFLAQGKCNTARDISQVRGMPRSLVSKAVDQLVRRGYCPINHRILYAEIPDIILLPVYSRRGGVCCNHLLFQKPVFQVLDTSPGCRCQLSAESIYTSF